MQNKKKLILLCIVITISLLAGCTSLKTDQTTVSVSGEGIVTVEPDMVSFNISVSESAETTAVAQQKTNKKISVILDQLKQQGIEDKDIKTESINFSTDYKWNDGERTVIAQRASQNISVTVNDLSVFPTLIDSLGTSVDGFEIYGTNFDVADKAKYYAEARSLAYKSALEKAELYALRAGMNVERPLTITENGNTGFSNRLLMKTATTMAAESMSVDTQIPEGTLEVSISVSVQFVLNK